MQVSHAQESDNYAIVGGGKSRDFRIAESGHAFKILSDALYSDKETAVVRETVCNAVDAHIAAGIQDRPIEITLSETQLTIRDFGPGIPDDKMIETYATYFASTKTKDDRQIGGFGLGCKAPFCLTDHFMVTSFHKHVQNTYALTIGNDDTDGKPGVQLMVSMATTQSGLLVTVPIDKTKHRAFSRAIRRVLENGGILAIVNGKPLENIRDYTGIQEAGFGMFKPASTDGYPQVNVLYGSVVYPLEAHEETKDILQKFSTLMNGSPTFDLVLWAPPSSIAVTPSREKLGYNEKTLDTIRKISKRALNQIQQFKTSQKKVLAIETLQGHRRHQFANFMSYRLGVSDAARAEVRFIGGKACARAIAISLFMSNGNKDMSFFAPIGAKYYRDHASGLVWQRSRRSVVPILHRDQYQYVLRKIMRAAMPVLDRPTIVYRATSTGRFFHYNKALEEYHKQSPMGLNCLSLVIAPSRAAAAGEMTAHFHLIDKDLKPLQIAEIRKNAERQGLKVTVIEAIPRKAPAPRNKVLPEDKPSELFAPFTFERRAPSKRGERTRYMVAQPGSLASPDSFIALALTRKKMPVVRPTYLASFIGPRQVFPPEDKFYQCVSEESTELFNRQDIELENCALPVSKEERDRLIKMGVPRLATLILEKLRKRIDRKKVADCFLAYCALGCEDSYHYRSYRDEKEVQFAINMQLISRRMACAVYMQPYKKSPEADEVFQMWKTARTLFATTITKDKWFDESEAAFFEEAKEEFKLLLADFEKFVPKEMVDFFKRMRKGKIKSADVPHLRFLSKVVKHGYNDIESLKAPDLERLALMIEAEGKNYLADEKVKQEKAIKREKDEEDE